MKPAFHNIVTVLRFPSLEHLVITTPGFDLFPRGGIDVNLELALTAARSRRGSAGLCRHHGREIGKGLIVLCKKLIQVLNKGHLLLNFFAGLHTLDITL